MVNVRIRILLCIEYLLSFSKEQAIFPHSITFRISEPAREPYIASNRRRRGGHNGGVRGCAKCSEVAGGDIKQGAAGWTWGTLVGNTFQIRDPLALSS